MHPAVIIVPLLGAVFGPRLWAGAQLRRHDVHDDAYLPANELARRLLDRKGLTLVRVESTDIGDHYDPVARAVRLNRDHFERCSLTAATTAAHEVGHALQDASGYWAFRLHISLARIARVTTVVGTSLLLAVPAVAIAARTPTPSRVLSLSAAVMFGTGLGAQLAALPSELDASFDRALPLLRDCCLSDEQAREARRILLACSLTYLASAAAPALVLAPWMVGASVAGLLPSPGRGRVRGPRRSAARFFGGGKSVARASSSPAPRRSHGPSALPVQHEEQAPSWQAAPRWRAAPNPSRIRAVGEPSVDAGGSRLPSSKYRLLRGVARPFVRAWLRAASDP